jgi:hypothetical protein
MVLLLQMGTVMVVVMMLPLAQVIGKDRQISRSSRMRQVVRGEQVEQAVRLRVRLSGGLTLQA